MTSGTARSSARRSVLVWNVVLLAIAGLIATIAVLQYRWIHEISTAMEVRIRGNLESLMTQWSLDFYGDLSTICVALQVGPDSGAQDIWTDYLQRYATWNQQQGTPSALKSAHADPALVSKVYIWETSGVEKPRLFTLDPDGDRIREESKIPTKLAPLLLRLRERSQSVPIALRAWELPSSRNSMQVPSQTEFSEKLNYPMTGWQFDESLPAIVHPLVHRPQPKVHQETQRPTEDEHADWIVIVLDWDTIQKKILPNLAQRYFGKYQELDYKLAVVEEGIPARIIYSSDVDFPAANEPYDSIMNVFGPPPESTEGHFWQSLKNVESLRREDWQNFSGPGWFPVMQYGDGTKPWMLIVKRRAGPLEAAVDRVWRTNLLTGLAVLVLLAATVGLVVLATQRVQRLAQLQMNFVTSVSHELRTPITVMLSAAENLADGVVEEPAEIREHGGLITGQARLLLDLVDRILLFAASRSGKNLQSIRPVHVSEILERVLQNLAALTNSEGIRVEHTLAPDLPMVLADPVGLSQCLQNLIINAIKYRGQSSWIGISAEVHQEQDRPKELQIHVQDRGIGIRESELGRIFEPFYRSPETLAKHVQGTGLGLTVSQRSMMGMGGRLTVTSELGVGSTFTVHLPLADSSPAAGPLVESISLGEQSR